MSITIPPIPAGIIDPANLYNEVYGHEPPLQWANPELHDRLAWVLDHVKFAVVSEWYALLNQAPNGERLRTATAMRIVIKNGAGPDADIVAGLDAETLWLMKMPESLAVALMTLAGTIPTQITPYPGFIARNPPDGVQPIGPEWVDHPWKPRRLFDALFDTRYAVGDIFESVAGRYKKVRVQTKPGAGPFGAGGEWKFAWELVWQR